jgi:hypothetical protein
MSLMAFEKEPTGYEKTVPSDLQGASRNLTDEVAAEAEFPHWEWVLFHIDEAMNWEKDQTRGWWINNRGAPQKLLRPWVPSHIHGADRREQGKPRR